MSIASETGLLAPERERIAEIVRDYFRPGRAAPEEIARFAFEHSANFGYGPAQIVYFLGLLFSAHGFAVKLVSEDQGREAERRENPLLRATGEALALARKKDREASRATAIATFEALVSNGQNNPHFAFYEAMKALT